MGTQIIPPDKASEIKDSLLDVIAKADELLQEQARLPNDLVNRVIGIKSATQQCLFEIDHLTENTPNRWADALETLLVEMGKLLFKECVEHFGDLDFQKVVEILSKITAIIRGL